MINVCPICFIVRSTVVGMTVCVRLCRQRETKRKIDRETEREGAEEREGDREREEREVKRK